MTNNMIISEMSNIDLYDLDERQVIDLALQITENINIKQLKEKVNEACRILSGVAEPCFGADVRYIALDNQKRLTIIYELLNNINLFETCTTNIKKNKLNCKDNSEYLFSYLLTTKNIVMSIVDYTIFRSNEKQEGLKQIAEAKLKYLNNGE